MATVTAVNALLNPRLSHEGTNTVIIRTGGGTEGSLSDSIYLLAKIPNLVTIIDGYVRHKHLSGSAPVSIEIGGTAVCSFTMGGADTVTRFQIPNLPLRVSVSDDVAQFVWLAANINSGGTLTDSWCLDVVVSYAKFGAGEKS